MAIYRSVIEPIPLITNNKSKITKDVIRYSPSLNIAPYDLIWEVSFWINHTTNESTAIKIIFEAVLNTKTRTKTGIRAKIASFLMKEKNRSTREMNLS